MAIFNEYVTSGREIKDTDKAVQYNNLDITGNHNTIFNDCISTKQHFDINDFNKEIHH